MIAAWVLRMVAASLLIAAAAWLLERALRAAERPRRWAWIGGLVAVVAAPFAALLIPGLGPALRVLPGATDVGAVLMVDRMVSVTSEIVGGGPEIGMMGVLWSTAVVVALAVYAAGWWRLRSARRAWRQDRVAGASVLVSAAAGPAAVGVLSPAIVVPEWLLSEDESVQRLVVLHEAEHLAAGDHLALALAPLAIVLMPWNVMLWWMVRRLRLAIELDCDSRVLARGVEPSKYGALLLDVAGRRGVGALSIALASPRSALEQRIEALAGAIHGSGRGRRAVLFTTGAVFCTLLACGIAPTAPTAGDDLAEPGVGGMKAAQLVQRFGAVGTVWMIDGEPATREDVLALATFEIAAVRVHEALAMHGEDELAPVTSSAVVNIMTPHYLALHPNELDDVPHRLGDPREKPLDHIRSLLDEPGVHIVIDGLESEPGELTSLGDSDIAEVEITRRRTGDTTMSGIRVETRGARSN